MSKKIQINNPEEFKIYLTSHTREETSAHFNLTLSKIDKLRVELNMPRKTFRYRELPGQFSYEQMQIIIGSLLGDGSLDLVGKHGKANSKYAENHSIKQLQWLEWKAEKLKPFSTEISTHVKDGRKKVDGKIINDPTKKLISCRLETVVHPAFTQLEKEWYLRDADNNYILDINSRRMKKLPDNLILTPDIISVWFFDDGSNNAKEKQATLNTQSFSRADCEILIQKLKSVGLNFGIAKNRNHFILITKASSYLELKNMVSEKLICQCLSYKTDLSKYKPPDYSTRFKKKGLLNIE